MAEPSLLERMGVGVALFATQRNMHGIRKRGLMSDRDRIQFKIIVWAFYLWITFTIFWNYFT